MKITRKLGDIEISIDLTPTELRLAYEEEQFEYDKQDFENDFHNEEIYEEIKDVLPEELEKRIIEDGAGYLRTNLDKYAMTYEFARSEATKDVIKKIVRYHFVTEDDLKNKKDELFYYCIKDDQVTRLGEAEECYDFMAADKDILGKEDSKDFDDVCDNYYMVFEL